MPEVQVICSDVFEMVFAPKMVLRQLVLAIALETGVVSVNQIIGFMGMIHSNFSSRSRLIRQLEEKQKTAESQDEWMSLAEQIDSVQENDAWRSEPNCPLYESDRLSSRIDEYVHLMRRRDIFDLMFTLRGGMARNNFGLLHEGLFSKALAGTKVLVETYHNVVCAALDFVCDSEVLPGDAPIPTDARLAFFNEARHSYGRTALMLSGGAALGFYHAGVVKALMKNGLLPRVLSGASAGSIVCSMIGTRTDEEAMDELFENEGSNASGHSGTLRLDFFRPVVSTESPTKCSNPLEDVWRNTAGGFHDGKKTWQLLSPIGIRKFTSLLFDLITGRRRSPQLAQSDTEHFRQCCRANIGNFTFQEAFDRTGRILNIIVSPQNRTDPPRLLNYLTSPHVLIWSAAVASSSLPGIFEPNKLLVKNADGTERNESVSGASFIDGSMEADLPMQQLSEMFNINHFIISQANPHAVMLANFNVDKSVWTNQFMRLVNSTLLFLKKQVKSWFIHMVEIVGGGKIAPLYDTSRGFATQVFAQEYEGRDIDISLVPWRGHRSLLSAFLHCIYNPTKDDFEEWIDAAERETWRYIPKIKSHVATEMTLDRCVQRLRRRLVVESRQNKRNAEIMSKKMGEKIPSFFNSPSLVNFGGLNIIDRCSIERIEDEEKKVSSNDIASKVSNSPVQNSEIRHGWNGMGLHGNQSSGSLVRSNSGGSGLFFFDEESEDDNDQVGENNPNMSSFSSLPTESKESSQYLKTTNMANFYYRKTKSYGQLTNQDIPLEFNTPSHKPELKRKIST